MDATRRDLEAAERLAAEVKSHPGKRRTWRYAETLLDLFEMDSFSPKNRRRIQAALVAVGLEPDPPVTDVASNGSVRFARPTADPEGETFGAGARAASAREVGRGDSTASDGAPRVFVSYRRDDCQPQANGLTDGLCHRLPGADVFIDIDSIPPGVDFEEHIQRWIQSCDVVLVLIGDNWLDRDQSEHRRIDDPDDFVRLEVVAALERRRELIPVLVEDARMPHPRDLPEEIRPLARKNAIELSDRRWRADVDRLAEAIRTRPGGDLDEPVSVRSPAPEQQATRAVFEIPARVTDSWIERTLPDTGGAQLEQLAAELRRRGWTEGELIDRVFAYAPVSVKPHPTRSGDPRRARPFEIPSRVTHRWLGENVPILERDQLARLAEVLYQRGWSEGEVEDAVYGRVGAAR